MNILGLRSDELDMTGARSPFGSAATPNEAVQGFPDVPGGRRLHNTAEVLGEAPGGARDFNRRVEDVG